MQGWASAAGGERRHSMGPQQMSRTVGQWKRMGLYHCDTPVKRELTDTLELQTEKLKFLAQGI